MNGLKSVLERVDQSSLDAGGAISIQATKALTAYRKRQQYVFCGVIAFVFVGVLVSWTVVLLRPQMGTTIKTLVGIAGFGSAGGGLEVARRVWKEWSRTDLLIVLLADASEAQVKLLIDKLIKAL